MERKSDEEAGLNAADVDTLNGALEVLGRIQTAEEATSFSLKRVATKPRKARGGVFRPDRKGQGGTSRRARPSW